MKKLFFFLILSIFYFPGYPQPLVINWQRCYGGSNDEFGVSIAKSIDGYFLFCGTDSNDGDIPELHGTWDYWVIKTDFSGNILWSKTYGGSQANVESQMKQTSDGGYILLGYTTSNDGEVQGNHGFADYWVVKIDSLGNIEWSKCLGGSYNDYPCCIDITKDSGYICNGYTGSNDGDVSGNHGQYDYWVVKLDKGGNLKWQRPLGGADNDLGLCVSSTVDGGAIVGGYTYSNDGDVQCSRHGSSDAWVVKLDSTGQIEWENCYGGSQDENVVSIIPTTDNGYIFTGITYSNDGDVSGNHGNGDFWVVKIDQWGNLIWQKCFGGSALDGPYFIKQSVDGNYFIGGDTYSKDGDVHGNHSINTSNADMWLIKIDTLGNLLWQQCFGGHMQESLRDMDELTGGNLLLLGGTTTSDNSGDVQCNHHGPNTSDVWFLSVTDTTYVGVDNQKKKNNNVTIYPNPATNNITIELSGAVKESTVSIFNIEGQQLITRQITKPKTQVDISTLPSGVYFVRLTNNKTVEVGKFVKE
jgi:hypothetical protein